jgi:hypothetical protein
MSELILSYGRAGEGRKILGLPKLIYKCPFLESIFVTSQAKHRCATNTTRREVECWVKSKFYFFSFLAL